MKPGAKSSQRFGSQENFIVTYPSGKTMRDNEINQQQAARWCGKQSGCA